MASAGVVSVANGVGVASGVSEASVAIASSEPRGTASDGAPPHCGTWYASHGACRAMSLMTLEGDT